MGDSVDFISAEVLTPATVAGFLFLVKNFESFSFRCSLHVLYVTKKQDQREF